MPSEQFSMREAGVADADALAAMHVASWRETYAGLLPAGMLAGLSVAGRAEAWRRIIAQGAAGLGTTVDLVEHDGRIVGFGSCGGQRDDDLARDGFDGEISAIYVLRDVQRLGLGRRIMGALATRLARQGHWAASLWVLRENAGARSFYERLGGILVGEKVEQRPDGPLVEVAYGWRSLPRLIDRTAP